MSGQHTEPQKGSDRRGPAARRVSHRADALLTGTVYYALSLSVVLLGALAGLDFVEVCLDHPSARRGGLVDGLAAWDGEWYARIVREGYSFDERRQSSIVFFPVLPVLAGAVSWLTGLRAETSLLAVSHLALGATFVLSAAYVRRRYAQQPARLVDFTLLALGLFPTTFYFRMAYTESLLLLLIVLTLYGIRRRWPVAALAAIVGLATATRPVGIALVAPLSIDLWRRSAGDSSQRADGEPSDAPRSGKRQWLRRPVRFVVRSAWVVPLSCWGLVAFVAYQAWALGEPWAFVKAQLAWRDRALPASVAEHAWALATLEPVRAVYDAGCRCYWAHTAPRDNALVNLKFATPAFLLGTAGLIVVGARRRWLDGCEWTLAALLLLIPYVLQSYRMCMSSQARFASACFPVYLVLGQVLARTPLPLAVPLLAASAVLLGTYAALFVTWHWLF